MGSIVYSKSYKANRNYTLGVVNIEIARLGQRRNLEPAKTGGPPVGEEITGACRAYAMEIIKIAHKSAIFLPEDRVLLRLAQPLHFCVAF